MYKNQGIYVNVITAWQSKINWAQIISFVAGAATMFGWDFDAETQATVLGAILGINTIITFVLRTFFTNRVTETSLPTE